MSKGHTRWALHQRIGRTSGQQVAGAPGVSMSGGDIGGTFEREQHIKQLMEVQSPAGKPYSRAEAEALVSGGSYHFERGTVQPNVYQMGGYTIIADSPESARQTIEKHLGASFITKSQDIFKQGPIPATPTAEALQRTPGRFGYVKQYEVETETGKNILYATTAPAYQTKVRTESVFISPTQNILYTTSKKMPKTVQVEGKAYKVVFKEDPAKIPKGLLKSDMALIEQKAMRGDVEFKITDPVKVKAKELRERDKFLGESLLGRFYLRKEKEYTRLASWEDPLGLRSAYKGLKGFVTGQTKAETKKELSMVQARTHLDIKASFFDAPGKEKAINVLTSPAATLGLSLVGGAGIGAGMGALGRVAPTVGKVAQVGLGTVAVAGITYDVGKEVYAKDYETAFVKGGFYAISLPIAMTGYKAGYGKGYSYASKKWVEKNFVVSKTDITSKHMVGDTLHYEGKYYGKYRPDFESKVGYVRGRFTGFVPAKQTYMGPITIRPQDAVTFFSGKAHYMKFGKPHVQDVSSISMSYKPHIFTDTSQYSYFKATGKTGDAFYKSGGLSHLQKGPTINELSYTQVKLHYFQHQPPGFKFKIGGYADLSTGDIYVRSGYPPRGTRHIIKHELLHQRYPYASESEIVDLTALKMPQMESQIKNYMRTGDLNFWKVGGVKTVAYSGYQSFSLSETQTGIISAQAEKGQLSEIMAKVSIKGLKHTHAPLFTDKPPTTVLEYFPKLGTTVKPDITFPLATSTPLKVFALPLSIKSAQGFKITTSTKQITRLETTQTVFSEQRPKLSIMSSTTLKSGLSRMLKITHTPATTEVSRQVMGTSASQAQAQEQALVSGLKIPQVSIQRHLLKTKLTTGTGARIIVPPPTIIPRGGRGRKPPKKLKFLEFELEDERKGKKKRILRKGLLADLFSVQQTHAWGLRATHPAPTPKMWEQAERTGFMHVPTVEMMKRKGGKRTRWV